MAESESDFSDISDADPNELLESLKNIDDLDAELFATKKQDAKPTPESKISARVSQKTAEKKRVSFHKNVGLDSTGKEASSSSILKSSGAANSKNIDLDLDDALAGLLSDEDEAGSLNFSGVKPSTKKQNSADDWLFEDDDADDLLDEGGTIHKQKEPEKTKRTTTLSVDSLMKPSSAEEIFKQSTSARKMTMDDFASSAKMSPEKYESPYKAAPASKAGDALDEGLGFGSYQPSNSGSGSRKSGRPRSRPSSDTANFFDFLADDSTASQQDTKVSKPISSASSTPTRQPPRPNRLESPTRPHTSEVSMTAGRTEGNKRPLRPTASDVTAKPHLAKPVPKQQKKEVVYDTPLQTKDSYEPPKLFSFEEKPEAARRRSEPEILPPPRRSRGAVESPSLSNSVTPPLVKQSPQTLGKNTDWISSSKPMVFDNFQQVHERSDDTLRMLETQLAQTKALLHNTELGYKADMELLKGTYDSRMELSQAAFEDLKSRVDRELGSIQESYGARIEVLRSAMQSHTHAETKKECEHQEEIKRLRNLHLQALDECRRDEETQITRLQKSHLAEVEAIKNSTYHTRNIETMMMRVEDATSSLQQLSTKYESAYRAVTQQSESVALGNKQLVAVLQNQTSQLQRSTTDAQIQLQQTASRLEGLVSEMNRKMEEQHYAMQLSHSNLQSAHAALQEERKQFMQQITMEREHLRKAHRETMTLQNSMQQEGREDKAKMLRAADELSSTIARYEEAKVAETERTLRRNCEHEEKMSELNGEKLEIAKRKAQLETSEEKLRSQQLELNSKLSQFAEEKNILNSMKCDLEQRENEVRIIAEKTNQSEFENERALQEARRINESQSSRLAEIHTEMKEMTKQRQLLAEERKSLARERGGLGVVAPTPIMTSSPAPAIGAGTQPTPIADTTPLRRLKTVGHPGSPGQQASTATVVLWRHTAQQDRSFLEDEQFFLETLKNSPYSKSTR